MRTLIYARFSSALQNRRSIDDQVTACRTRCEAEGWTVVDIFTDYAIGGGAGVSEDQRPGMAALLARLDAGDIDQVIADTTSRIARGVGDSDHIRKCITHAGARLFTLADGQVDNLVGGIKGVIDEHMRVELAHNIRRAQKGRAAQGLSPAGIAYGYRKVLKFDDRGEQIKGLREPNPETAAVVVRIFTEHAAGKSIRDIVNGLNAEGIPPPSGKFWRSNTVSGSAKRGDGILRNRLYRGELVVGRTQKTIDPRTRKVRIKPKPASEWQVTPVPHLRIIDDELWAASDAARLVYDMKPLQQTVRPKRLLSGLVKCGCCGSNYIVVRPERWGCSSHRDSGSAACANERTIATADLERRVLGGLSDRLLDPDLVSAFVKKYHAERAQRSREEAKRDAGLRRKLSDAEGRIARLVEAVATGGGEFTELRSALADATRDRDSLRQVLADADAAPVVALHPQLADEYRRLVRNLADALSDPADRSEAAPSLRAMIDSIVVLPKDERQGVDIELTGHLAAMLELATGKAPKSRNSSGMIQLERVAGIEPA
ncbi:recombinase family protein [Sphingopyxis macrogoltabida]|uniref:recombinase family protein n=1 Tax=Sphingopyxis macrogoltabida TaxID=33050 RepID=UPI0009EB6B0F|nr:recombinase family protein [Sphingopyxis macrogoltabida]